MLLNSFHGEELDLDLNAWASDGNCEAEVNLFGEFFLVEVEVGRGKSDSPVYLVIHYCDRFRLGEALGLLDGGGLEVVAVAA